MPLVVGFGNLPHPPAKKSLPRWFVRGLLLNPPKVAKNFAKASGEFRKKPEDVFCNFKAKGPFCQNSLGIFEKDDPPLELTLLIGILKGVVREEPTEFFGTSWACVGQI